MDGKESVDPLMGGLLKTVEFMKDEGCSWKFEIRK